MIFFFTTLILITSAPFYQLTLSPFSLVEYLIALHMHCRLQFFPPRTVDRKGRMMYEITLLNLKPIIKYSHPHPVLRNLDHCSRHNTQTHTDTSDLLAFCPGPGTKRLRSGRPFVNTAGRIKDLTLAMDGRQGLPGATVTPLRNNPCRGFDHKGILPSFETQVDPRSSQGRMELSNLVPQT